MNPYFSNTIMPFTPEALNVMLKELWYQQQVLQQPKKAVKMLLKIDFFWGVKDYIY